ncbi:hypothetical protein LSH36_2g08061 [Paralvinella palmiformis]|uniref:phosphatidylinositol-3,4-bisphosphate 4-phosphatase n=1 Tax=Paralvinella palmiformis TaxID=53620 RepID=A0AAD9KG37_9ANNE|nr:hypothetical protein LSH36_2g08061 [Paralvinella palmiformis]
MRFNNREMMILAQQRSAVFDKEGVLQIKEKQDGLFRKGEVYVPRLFRLRGNLLFYFKTTDPSSEVQGLMVLERVVVELDLEEELPYSFILVFEGEDKVVHLAANSELDRDSWIEHLHISSYECMKMQLESLRDQIKSRTGHDPINNPEPSELPDSESEESAQNEPFLEMCIACDGLPYNSIGREPDTFATIHYLTPPHQQWTNHARTEIVEKTTSPVYLTTIGFCNPRKVLLSTCIKICVNDVKERMTNTMTQIGTVQFTFASDPQDVGHITVLAWHNVDQFEGIDGTASEAVL